MMRQLATQDITQPNSEHEHHRSCDGYKEYIFHSGNLFEYSEREGSIKNCCPGLTFSRDVRHKIFQIEIFSPGKNYEGLMSCSESNCQITSFNFFLITSSLNSSCLGTTKKTTHMVLGDKGFAFFIDQHISNITKTVLLDWIIIWS